MSVPRSVIASAFFCLLALPAASHAADLYKCSDANGVISIQSSPCATGSTQVWKRDANPEPAQSPEQAAQAEARQEKHARDAHALSLAAGTTPRETATRETPPRPTAVARPEPAGDPLAKGPCRRAHELARDIRGLALLEMRSDQMLRLDEWVVKQCENARSGE